ncbi:MAG: EsaB/YukD family protein [Peptococcaceae bacterium]|jgi:hypothetical protein|nr:EsaB/YukD family protein [Peptococcaceae bacterium]
MASEAYPEAFIVTVSNESGSFNADLEIPSRLPFAAYKAKLLEILKILGGREFQSWRGYSLQFKERLLDAEDTLAHVGAFDGSRLTVRRM